jgi:hypothetical protein
MSAEPGDACGRRFKSRSKPSVRWDRGDLGFQDPGRLGDLLVGSEEGNLGVGISGWVLKASFFFSVWSCQMLFRTVKQFVALVIPWYC